MTSRTGGRKDGPPRGPATSPGRSAPEADPAGGDSNHRRRLIPAFLLGIPVLLTVGAYVWLALDRSTLLLWDVPVHESGRFTLTGTVLYVEHFVREIPIDVAYALFLVAALAGSVRGGPTDHSSLAASPGGQGRDDGNRIGANRRAPSATLGWTALTLAALLVAVAVGVTATRGGWGAVWVELLQHRTRPELVDPGSHWRYHWLSTLWFGVAAHLLVPIVVEVAGLTTAATVAPRPGSATPRDRQAVLRVGGWTLLAWAYFVVLSLAFGVSAEVFADLRYVGHQAREIATHGPVTLPLALGAVLATGWPGGPSTPADPGQHGPGRRAGRWTLAVPFVVVPAYLGVVALSGNVMGAGQTDQGLAAMVAGHLFEHTLDYLFVTFLTVSGCAWMARRLPARPD